MGLFSIFRKNTQESAAGDEGEFQSRAEQDPAGRSRAKRKRGSQDNEAIDPVLPEKKRARRRLVGAIALVLAAIIGLPMILDSEPKPLAEDIAIQIPSRDKPGAVAGGIRLAPAASASAAASKSSVAGLDKNEEVIDPAAAVKKAPEQKAPEQKAPEPAVTAAPVKPALVEPKPVAKVEPKPTPKAELKAEPKVAAKPAGATDDAARANAILEGKTDIKPVEKTPAKPKVADKKASKYVLQVAALASQDKVNELQGKLKGAGLQSYTQKVPTESGTRIRVRVGPFGSKDEAEKARARLVKLGLNGTLVPA
jgi:DedD protein